MANKQTILKWFFLGCWVCLGASIIVLLVAANQHKESQQCKAININIKGVSNNFFVDKSDILATIERIEGGHPIGKSTGSFHLKDIELALQKNIWIRTVQLFFNNNDQLEVEVWEREPVARIFTTTGTTFYIDSSLAMLPLSEKYSARLPVFTGFPSDKKVLTKMDSLLLADVLHISLGMLKNPFRMALIDQTDILPDRNFEMIPKFGTGVIEFGDGSQVEEKFNRLQLFYQQVIRGEGANKYSAINVQYKNQIVARIKGAADFSADSLRALEILKRNADNAASLAADSAKTIVADDENNSTNTDLIQQSIQRDEEPGEDSIRSTPTRRATVPSAQPATVTQPAAVAPKKLVTVVVQKPPVKQPAPSGSPKPPPKQPAPKPPVRKPNNDY